MKYFASILLLTATDLYANLIPTDTAVPVSVQADRVEYNASRDEVVATGHVLFIQKTTEGVRKLHANKVIHNGKTNKVTAYSADGESVMLYDINGDVLEADTFDLTDDFKEGTISTLKLFTKDKATLHAKKGVRKNQEIAVMESADYTPCKLCKTKSPLWQMKAESVTHDKANKTITYKHARLEVKGVPILYTPYFSHPDPSVKRKSGILSPTFVQNNDLGYSLGIPVYYVINDQQDMTLTPVKTTKQSGIIQGEYRSRFYNGMFTAAGSYTRSRKLPPVDKNNLQPNGPRPPKPDRWNIAIQSRKDLTDHQLIKLDVKRASDTTYLERYSAVRQSPFIVDNKSLTSNLTWQYFEDTHYADVQAYAFQTDAAKTTPLVLPKASYHYQSETPVIGGTTAIEGGLLGLYRQWSIPGRAGTQMYRASNGASWKRPWILPYGQLVTAQLSTRFDYYLMRDYYDAVNANTKEKNVHQHIRLFPQGSLAWELPLQKNAGFANWIINPQMMLVSSPLNVLNRHIPNEDSLIFELDDITMKQPNRFNGIDRVDSGTRFVYGLENTLRFSKQRSISLFIGQSRRLDNQSVVKQDFGEDGKTSDIVTRLKVKPSDMIAMRHRMAMNPALHRVRYSEIGITAGKPIFKIDCAHVFLNRSATLKTGYTSQINGQVSSQITEQWKVGVGQIRNLKRTAGGASFATYVSATYDDECFYVDLGMYKNGYQDRDIKKETSFLVSVNFKTFANFSLSPAPKYPSNMLTQGL